jgi:hypothetical protein
MHTAPSGKRTNAVWACRGDKSKATFCYQFFSRAMCTEAEFDKLREFEDDGLRRKVVMNLNDLLVANLWFTYQRSVFDNATQKKTLESFPDPTLGSSIFCPSVASRHTTSH